MAKLTPLKAIRKQCVSCMGGSPRLVADCPGRDCPLYPYRMGRIPEGADRGLLGIIRKYCLECGGSAQEVKGCQGDTAPYEPCPLYEFRLGKSPNYSESAREKFRQMALKRQAEKRICQKRQPKLPLNDS